MTIQLVTLGGLRAIGEAGELDWLLSQHSRAALFVYLAVERRVSRETVTAVFWPDSDAENARHALRQSLYQLRRAIGAEWIESRAHELAVTADIRADAIEFARAVDRGDLTTAVTLYRGPFLDGVHLVDLPSWEGWVDARRGQYARGFRKACRVLIDAKRAESDMAGALEVAELWVARDPLDDEAQHRLIESLAAAGERAEAIRQYETYTRLLESDGLEPLDETVTLIERLRAESIPLPALRSAAVGVRPGAPVTGVAIPESSPPTTSGRRRRTWPLVAGSSLLILGAVAWALHSRSSEPTGAPTAPTIAVFPFSVRGADAVRYLGAGIVNLLGAALDGAGSLRPVDVRATFAAVRENDGRVADARGGDRVASRLGASMFVLGDVVGAGGQVQIAAAVYRTASGCSRWRSATVAPGTGCVAPVPSARAVVTGSADSVFALVDALAARLLGELGDPSADRLLRTASLTTTSLPAFKSYLQGEEAMRAGEFERAADAYLAALGHDSSFALAYYRLALAREWAPLPGEDSAATAAARNGERLTARDRTLLQAFRQWRAGNAIEADRAYRAILARYPDDVDAWFQLAEIQFHHGPLLGHPVGESEEAWRRVLAYEPRSLFAITHLARVAVGAGRVSTLDSLLAPFSPEALRTDRRLEEIVLLRALARGDTALSHALARSMSTGEGLAIWRVMVFLTAFSPDPTAMRSVTQKVIGESVSPTLRADLHWFGSLLDLAGGRLRAEQSARAAAADAEREVPAEHRRHGFDAVTEWFAATLPLPYADTMLLRVRRQAASLEPVRSSARGFLSSETALGSAVQIEPVRQYTLGILSVRVRDSVAAAAAAATLHRLATAEGATALTRDLDRGLRARIEWAAARPRQALAVLETLESRDSQGDVDVSPFASRAGERYLRAELLVSLGRDVEALRWLEALGVGSVTEVPLRAVAHLRQAEIHERLGHRNEAARHYARVVELWRDADAEFQAVVDSARRRITALGVPSPSRAP